MNPLEAQLAAALQKKGLVVYRNGWPDFLVTDRAQRTGMALELKTGKDKLRPEQIAMHAALGAFGIPTFVVREDFIRDVNKRGRKIALPAMLQTLKDRHQALEVAITQMQVQLDRLTKELETATIVFDTSDAAVDAAVIPRIPDHLLVDPPIAPYATSRLIPDTCVPPTGRSNGGLT
jgi:VRR-NUC domain